MFRKQLTTGRKKYYTQIFGLSLTLFIVCNVNTYAQNINTAENGLTKSSDTVLLGGTLTRNTDIDLGSNWHLGFKKGSANYFSILNNGTMRLEKFKNNYWEDSVLSTDQNGNLKFKPFKYWFHGLNVENVGFTVFSPKGYGLLMHNITQESNQALIEMRNNDWALGQTNEIFMRPYSTEFRLFDQNYEGIKRINLDGQGIKTSSIRGVDSSHIQVDWGGIELYSTYTDPEYGYKESRVTFDAGAFSYGGPDMKFSIQSDGNLYLPRYLNNETEDSLLTTDMTGNVKLKSLGSLFRQYGGIVNEGDGYRLGGELDQTVLTMMGESSFEIKTDDDFRSIRMFREYELREEIIELKNSQSSLWLEGSKIAAKVSDSENGQYSRFSIQDNQNTLSLNLPGRWSSIIQNNSGSVDLSAGADDEILGPTHYNIWRLDTAGAGFHVMDIPKFSIKNDGTLNLPKYLNNVAEDSVLTTDAEGNVKFKSLSQVVPSLSYLNGLSKEGDSVLLGGELFRNTEIKLLDHNFVLKGANATDSLTMFMGIDGLRSFNLNNVSEDFEHSLGFSDNFSLWRNSTAGSSQFTAGVNGLNLENINNSRSYTTTMQVGDGAANFRSQRAEGSSASINLASMSHMETAPDQDPTTIFEEGVKIFAETDGKGNLFTVDSAGFTFTNQLPGSLDLVRSARFGHNGRITFDHYKNNVAGDSVLTTDAAGNLRLKYFAPSAGGGGADSAWAYDSINIYNRNEGNVGIGTLTPTAKLHTLGSIRFESFKNNLQGDSVLTTDPDGNLKFVYLPYGSGGGGDSSGGIGYAFRNGLLQANGIVSLGGSLEDSVKIDLGGHLYELNDGPSKLLSISPNGNIGIGSAASNHKLTIDGGDASIGNIYDSVGWGRRFWFNGYANADPLYLGRYNIAPDASELRLSISDDGAAADKFNIGHILWNNGAEWVSNFVVQANGHAGIGTADITGELAIGKQHGSKLSVGNSAWAKTAIVTTGNSQANGDYTDLLVPGSSTNTAIIRLNQAGNVGIGTQEPDALYRLSVNGKIRAKGLRVQSSGWADFVFEPGYSLMKLPELEKFVKTNKHLPGIPTATEVNVAGYDVGETQVQLLQKIEELTLYIIELNKQVKTLEEKNKKLEAHQTQVEKLQQQMDELRKMILNK